MAYARPTWSQAREKFRRARIWAQRHARGLQICITSDWVRILTQSPAHGLKICFTRQHNTTRPHMICNGVLLRTAGGSTFKASFDLFEAEDF